MGMECRLLYQIACSPHVALGSFLIFRDFLASFLIFSPTPEYNLSGHGD